MAFQSTTAQGTSYPEWIIKSRNVHPTNASLSDVDITKRTAVIKDRSTGMRYTLEELSWDHNLSDYIPVPISDGKNADENNDLFLDHAFINRVKNSEVKFEGYADPSLDDKGHLPIRLSKELRVGIADRYRLDDDGNVISVKVNRRSHTGELRFDNVTGLPLNPLGRTGLTGRGFLGRWGPNHAADCLLVRFKDGKLQVALAFRVRDGRWAIPGGMVDFDENAVKTLLRELSEETGLNLLEQLDAYFFSDNIPVGDSVFNDSPDFTSWIATKRQVDDNRNTDCAWMETMAVVVVLGEKLTETFTKFNVTDTDEIGTACWVDVTHDLLSGQSSHTVQTSGKTYSGTIWESHVKLLNDLITQIVDHGLATLHPDGSYLKA